MTQAQVDAAARVADRRDRLKGADHVTRMYKDHYTIDYNAPPMIPRKRDPQVWTHGPGGWWKTRNGRAI